MSAEAPAPQAVVKPLTRSAIFLVVTLNAGPNTRNEYVRCAGTSLRSSARWGSGVRADSSPVS